MLTIIPVNLSVGVVSVLVTFTELLPADAPSSGTSSSCEEPVSGAPGTAPVHCDSAMELVTPAVGPAAIGYSFDPGDGGPVQLPPVWRCGCGFQLDAWIRSPFSHLSGDESVVRGRLHFLALSA